MARVFHSLFALSLLQLAACGGGDEETTEPMTEQVTALGTEIQELTELADTHHGTVGAAATLAAVTTEETAYDTAAMAHHDEIHHHLGEMDMCSHSGQPPATTDMMEVVESIETELDTHKTNVAAAVDLAAAQTEETRHDTAMDGLLADAQTAQQALASGAGDFMCPHHAGTDSH